MKYLPGIAVNELNGTMKGVTAQRWRGLGVFRKKPTPHNPMTPRQTDVRIITAQIAEAWREELVQGQRIAWNQRAKNYPWTDVFGREIRMTGLNLFVKLNFPLVDFGLPKQITPPPTTEPPELDDLTVVVEPGQLYITVPQLTDATVTAQTPFLDIQVAGGFLSANLTENALFAANIQSQALPAGRVHQEADFKHVLYAADKPIVLTPDQSEIFVFVPAEARRNVVVRIKRFNKYGNFSTERILEGIVTGT